MTLCRVGPFRSMASMRARYLSTRERDVSRPDCMRCWRSAMVASSRSNAGVSCAGGGAGVLQAAATRATSARVRHGPPGESARVGQESITARLWLRLPEA